MFLKVSVVIMFAVPTGMFFLCVNIWKTVVSFSIKERHFKFVYNVC